MTVTSQDALPIGAAGDGRIVAEEATIRPAEMAAAREPLSISQPNVFAVLVPAGVAAQQTAALVRGLDAKGVSLVGAAREVRSPLSEAPGLLLVCFTYLVAADADILDRRNAKLTAAIARIFRRNGVRGWLLGRAHLARLAGEAEVASLLAVARRGDRDLALAEDEVFIRDLSQNRARSSVWLVRRGDALLVRKAYSLCARNQIANELAARRELSDPRVLEIAERRGDVLYLPFVETAEPWSGRLLEFFPRERARAVFDFLEAVARSGHAMIDINPSAFLFDAQGALKVVDFEFFAQTTPAQSFVQSKDYTGAFDGVAAPARNGYRRYWYDPLGGDLDAVMNASPQRYALRKLAHLLLFRLPQRLAGRAAELAKHERDRIVRAWGLRKGCFRI